MKPRRILHVTPYAPAAWAYGGIPRVVAALAAEQARRGHAVTICTTDAATADRRLETADGTVSRFRPHPATRTDDGVTLRVFPNLSNRVSYHLQGFFPIGLSRYLAAHAHEFDVAHLHAYRNLPGVIAARHLRRAGVPYILQPHGTAPLIERRLALKRTFDFVTGARVLKGAARIVAVSEAERRDLLRLGVAGLKIRVVGNPVACGDGLQAAGGGRAPAAGAPQPAATAPPPAARRPQPVIVFLGKLTPRKNVDILIRAFARLEHPDATLVIAGNDMGSGETARRLVRELGLDPRVRFTGLLEGDARLHALADATVVAYPSTDEIFGLVPLESILAGTPVVVSDDSGCGEIINRVGGGLVTPAGDVDALAVALARVIDQAPRWRDEAARAADRVRASYSPRVIVDRLDEVYRDVAGESSRVSGDGVGVSFVIPVRNGARWVRSTLEAIWADQGSRPFEVIVVDDGSEDSSVDIARAAANGRPLRIIAGPGRGASAALNAGFRAARYPIVCQVDQDVTIRRGWTERLVGALDDPRVAAAQGRYVLDRSARVGARVMAIDLEQRYDALGTATDHVCTGNTAYRAEAVHAAGLFDESLGYGNDNDLSYRLRAAGFRLAFVRDATSVHHWRDSFPTYLRQQYGFGYGRLDVVAKHPSRAGGDSVSGTAMMLHPVGLALGLALLLAAAALAISGGPAVAFAIAGTTIISGLALERAIAGLLAWHRFGEASSLLFPLWHLARDAAWVAAMVAWTTRRALFLAPEPAHSMRARDAQAKDSGGDPRVELATDPPPPTRVIGIIPAHNERAVLPSVLGEIQSHHPALDLLVVDDGSTDGTSWLLDELGARYVRLPERMGVGTAMRTGLGFAVRLGYDAAVRLDGDGQHRPADIDVLLSPILGGRADVVLGTRYATTDGSDRPVARAVQRLLAAWMSAATGSTVTDPTSGYCAIGPRAIRLLAEHHPTGYAEPELRLFLSRNGLTTMEVPVGSRARLAGRSSLTPVRLAGAAARVVLALLTVPFRRAVVMSRRD